MIPRHLSEALQHVYDELSASLCVMLPGTVERYDAAEQKAAVLPSIRRRYTDGEEQDRPVIEDVPVVWPRGGSASLTMPLKRGDGVMLLFSDRSLDRWLDRGGVVTPDDRRKHSESDAVAVPGLWSFADVPGDASDDGAVLRNGSGRLRIDDRGRVALGNDIEELLGLIGEFMEQVAAGIAVPGSPLTTAPVITTLRARLEAIKGSL